MVDQLDLHARGAGEVGDRRGRQAADPEEGVDLPVLDRVHRFGDAEALAPQVPVLVEAGGLDKDRDLRRERLGVAESVNAIKDRKIDAFFWVGGLPTAAITDLASTPGVKIKLIDHADLVPAMNRKYGELYVQDVIPKDMYRGMDADNRQATVMNLLVAHQNMDEKTAYDIVKAVFDHKEELVRVHKEAENFKLENQKKEASPIPWHPGAVKYFSEKGIKLQ